MQQYKEVIGEFNYYELKATYRSTNQIVAYFNEVVRANIIYRLLHVRILVVQFIKI